MVWLQGQCRLLRALERQCKAVVTPDVEPLLAGIHAAQLVAAVAQNSVNDVDGARGQIGALLGEWTAGGVDWRRDWSRDRVFLCMYLLDTIAGAASRARHSLEELASSEAPAHLFVVLVSWLGHGGADTLANLSGRVSWLLSKPTPKGAKVIRVPIIPPNDRDEKGHTKAKGFEGSQRRRLGVVGLLRGLDAHTTSPALPALEPSWIVGALEGYQWRATALALYARAVWRVGDEAVGLRAEQAARAAIRKGNPEDRAIAKSVMANMS